MEIKLVKLVAMVANTTAIYSWLLVDLNFTSNIKTSGLHLLSDSDNKRFFYQRHGYQVVLASKLRSFVMVYYVASTKYRLMTSITNQTAPPTSPSHSRSRMEASVVCEGDHE